MVLLVLLYCLAESNRRQGQEMHDINFIREKPQEFDAGLKRRGLKGLSATILEKDMRIRALRTSSQEAQQRRNELSQKIGAMKREGQDVSGLMAEVNLAKEKIADLELEEKKLDDELFALMAGIPNLPDADVPDGKDENDNVEIRRVGAPRKIANPKDHVDIGEALGMMDIAAAAKMSGSRFVILSGQLARLQRALGNFMLDIHTKEFGYTEYVVPLLVKSEAMFGTGQLPKFAEEAFQTTAGMWLIPTAEVPVTNMVRDSILDEHDLPMRFTSLTPNFRSEAGAAGKDTRGMIRNHQFYKVEMVSIVTPEKSKEEHERFTGIAETVLKRLELPFRTIVICTGDMGFGQCKTYDIEVWMPSQNKYREISSCSNYNDFQARRMKAKYRPKNDKALRYVHTLNGTGVAISRCIPAIMENYQEGKGFIIPHALRPYMDGLERISVEE